MPSWLEPVTESVANEAKLFNDKLEKILASQPSIHTVPTVAVRTARKEGKGLFGPVFHAKEASDHVFRGSSGPVNLRVVKPTGQEPKGIYLHIHGGGWTLGGADQQDAYLVQLANATGLVAVSVEYRLAPEDPFPAGATDCEEAARWLVDKGATELGAPPRFAIGGESAGAHLAVLTLIRVPGVFYAANLVYGAYDLSGTPSVRAWGDRNLVLSGPIITYFTENFTPKLTLEERKRPEISPLYADLRRMPPALFTVGDLDPLLDDTLFMEARWRAAGNSTTLRCWPHAVHGFTAFPIELARLSNNDQFEFLQSRLA